VVVGDVDSAGRVFLPLLLFVGLQAAHNLVEIYASLALLVPLLYVALHHVKKVLVNIGDIFL
jgi:hypothetical protein